MFACWDSRFDDDFPDMRQSNRPQMRLLSEIHSDTSTQEPQISPFPSELPLSELGFDNYIEQSHCQPFLKSTSASNWCQFAAEVWDGAENALEPLPGEPPSVGYFIIGVSRRPRPPAPCDAPEFQRLRPLIQIVALPNPPPRSFLSVWAEPPR